MDQSLATYQFVNTFARQLKAPIKCVKSDVFKYLEKANIQTNIIFADPPYGFEDELFFKIPELVFKNNLLLEEGLLIIEHSKHTILSNQPYFCYSKNYGGNVFSFFEIK